jgi:hypothetical protein
VPTWDGDAHEDSATLYRARGRRWALPQAGWAMWATQAAWPTGLIGPKARRELLLELKYEF